MMWRKAITSLEGLTFSRVWGLRAAGLFIGTVRAAVTGFVEGLQSKKWVSGLRKIPKPSTKVFIHGLSIMIPLVVIQLLLDAFQNSFLLYMPPIGFALFLFTTYGIQPIIIGVLNIIEIHYLYDCEGWQIGFWLNGFFLLLVFAAINLMIQTMAGAAFSLSIGIVEILLLSYPFGYLGKFSNRGTPKNTQPAATAECDKP